MAKPKKPQRPKARRPRGFEDRSADSLRAEMDLVARAFAVYESFGFEPLQTPAFEYADALGKFLPDEDRPNTGVFSLRDDDEQWLSLRYDLTAPLARFVAEHYNDLPKPFRRYQSGTVWRNEKPGPGRFREFVQCDADTVGAGTPASDAEMIIMAAEVARAAGLADGQFQVKVNNRKLLDGLLETAGVANDAEKRLRTLRAIDKLDRLGREGVEALLGEGREDESGDYTEGAALAPAAIQSVLDFTELAGEAREPTMATLDRLVGGTARGADGVAELRAIHDLLSATGYGEDAVAFDTSVVRGLGYYTGPVYEVELLADIRDAKGRPVRVGSIGGGGRYDDLVSRFRGQPVPATGFSFGVSRYLTALDRLGKLEQSVQPPVIVCVFDKSLMPDYFRIAQELRAAGIRSEVFVGGGNVTKQLKYADRRGAKVALLMGEDELSAGEVTLKDLEAGALAAQEIETNEEWKEARPAQVQVPRGDLVARVKAILG